jgi:hypothetical protein
MAMGIMEKVETPGMGISSNFSKRGMEHEARSSECIDICGF